MHLSSFLANDSYVFLQILFRFLSFLLKTTSRLTLREVCIFIPDEKQDMQSAVCTQRLALSQYWVH